jgi:hypothetical protein
MRYEEKADYGTPQTQRERTQAHYYFGIIDAPYGQDSNKGSINPWPGRNNCISPPSEQLRAEQEANACGIFPPFQTICSLT